MNAGSATLQSGIFCDGNIAEGVNIAGLKTGAPRDTGAPRENFVHKGWYTRGYLPHYDRGGIYQTITYRLGDSLPESILESMQEELKNVNPEFMEMKRRKKIEKYLDNGHGSCVLKDTDCAKIIENAWRYFDGVRYDLIAYVLMPNHVHLLVKIYNGFELAKIVKSWKSYSARYINELNVSGNIKRTAGLKTSVPRKTLWQRGYWDRFIRDEKHFCEALKYIKKNFDSNGVLIGAGSAALQSGIFENTAGLKTSAPRLKEDDL